MSDRRLTPFSGRVALHGTDVDAAEWTDGALACCTAPLVDLLRAPSGARDRQLLRGASVTVIDRQGPWSFVQAQDDGYCGWVQADALGPHRFMTHRVHALGSHLYSRPDLKSPETGHLSLNTRLSLGAQDGAFAQAECGHWVPLQHVTPVSQAATDPILVARQFLGVPYLWGGNSCWGIDCSGLVQAAWLACGWSCPGDSDLQQRTLGTALPPDSPVLPGDVLFWRGHVALVSDTESLLHATAFSMSVIEEPLRPALARIALTAPLAAHLRPPRAQDT